MVQRIYVEKKPELASEARALLRESREFLGISSLQQIRILQRYDVEGLDPASFEKAVRLVLSEPQLDLVRHELEPGNSRVLCVEYLPGQFDQRADSAAQCIQILFTGERPLVRTARVYLLDGNLSEEDMARFRHHVINPVESREASLELPETLDMPLTVPESVPTLTGFTQLDRDGLEHFVRQYALAMDVDDIAFCQSYFRSEQRDPTLTEIRMIDTYWSDHCRHTTFLTRIDDVTFDDPILEDAWQHYLSVRNASGDHKPVCLMDLGTIAARYLRQQGLLDKLDESEEINACTVRMTVSVNGKDEPWLLLFKNETHNHPTEIEPFGGAATCIGGAIRDPLSGRSYVYGAMRVTGAADPLQRVEDTLPGKLPQRKIVTTAAAGYSSYGNQIGLATGIVDELYHPGYAAKRMEIGAVIAAAPEKNVRRERPCPGDVVILLGGATGRDGCGGATGSSKAHTATSLETCGAEVQKGNAPEERKLQRLFRNPEASLLIKRCNDFGAGGVSVAIGELADGLDIQLDLVPKKYEGLDGTELAISESQERMAVVVDPKDTEHFLRLAAEENLQATVVATVKEEPYLTMHWKGHTIVHVSREFLNSNGAEKHQVVHVPSPVPYAADIPQTLLDGMQHLAADLNVCSRRGLSERFDSTIGAGTVLMPFGGIHQLTPIQAMVQKIPLEHGQTDTCSFMAYGYNPMITEKSPFHGAYLAVVESVSRLIATGASIEDTYLTFQEYFLHPGKNPDRWGQPTAALLGALEAQLQLGLAAIGGKDSMSGTFEQLDVPPTLVSFAVTTGNVQQVVSPEFKQAGHYLLFTAPASDARGLPDTASLKSVYASVTSGMRDGHIMAAWTPGIGGIAEGILKMCLGNRLGVKLNAEVSLETLFGYACGGFLVESDLPLPGFTVLGSITDTPEIVWNAETLDLASLQKTWEDKLEPVYPCNIPCDPSPVPALSHAATQWHTPAVHVARPQVLIPAFPGTNCEVDSARAIEAAGGNARIMVIRNRTSGEIAESVRAFAQELARSQMVFIPGGFSGGDEPDGSGKFITAFFRNDDVRQQVTELLDHRDGLMLGICNGFQALIKLGLVPYGRITDTDAHAPTLTFNTIARHQSRLVRTRVASTLSPFLSACHPGEIYTVPISHGEGRFLCEEPVLRELTERNQIATQYVDLDGNPTHDVRFNPNDSVLAVEGITSPDGRVLGKMGHSERFGSGLYRNVPGCYDMKLFESAMAYFRGV